MNIQVQTALIAAAVSIAALLINLLLTRAQLKSQKETFEREVTSRFRINAYELRIKTYPAAFAITKELGKDYDREVKEINTIHNDAREKLREWINSETMLVISDFALEKARELDKELKKNPDQPNKHFSEAQVNRMWKCRQNFRRALRKDLGLLYENTEF